MARKREHLYSRHIQNLEHRGESGEEERQVKEKLCKRTEHTRRLKERSLTVGRDTRDRRAWSSELGLEEVA